MSEKAAKYLVLGACISFLVNATFFFSVSSFYISNVVMSLSFIPFSSFVILGYLVQASLLLFLFLILFVLLGLALGIRCFQWRNDPSSHRISLAFVSVIGLLCLSPIASLLAVIAAAVSGAPLEINDYNMILRL